MRKIVKQILSVTLCSAMVVTSMSGVSLTVNAAEVDTDMIANTNAKYNLAKDGEVSYLHMHSDGAGTTMDKVTDGSVTTAQFVINDSNDNWGAEGGETYVVVDLGDYYDASTINQIVVAYKDAAANDTVLTRSYSIMYSTDGVNFDTIAVDNRQVSEFDDTTINATVDDVSSVVGKVRYVKVYYPVSANYGIQLKEVAVLDTDLNAATVTVEQCENAAGVTVASPTFNTITYNVEAGADQEEYKYNVYLDGITQIGTNVDAGVDYTIEGIVAGTHTIKVVSVYDGKVSEGITSEEVVVEDISSLITSARDIAYIGTNENAKIIEPISVWDDSYTIETVQDVLNGAKLTNTSDNASIRTASGATASVYIDLGAKYAVNEFDKFMMVVPHDRINPGTFTVSFGAYDDSYVNVGSYTNVSYSKYGDALIFVGDYDFTNYSEAGVRYVKLDITGGGNGGAYGYGINEIGIILNTENPTVVDGVTVVEAKSVTAVTSGYNTVELTIEANEGQEGFTYNVSFAGQTLTGVAAGTYTFEEVVAGTYTATVKSVDTDGNISKGVTSNEVVVEDGFIYTRTDGVNELFADTNENGNNYIRYEGVTGMASSGDAAAALDNNAGTRWESGSADPQSITVDLGSVMTIKEVSMTWEAANAKTYTVEVSTDETNWKTVATVSNQAEGGRLDEIVLKEAVSAQYVKINGTERNLTYGYSIWELAIYGPSEAPAVEVEAPEIIGFQMNTNVEGVSSKSPSFRVMTEMPENVEIGNYGTVYALAANVADISIEAGQNNVFTHVATAAGTVSYNGVSYYALTFTDNGTSAEAMKAEYVVRPYVIVDGEYKYGAAYTVSIYEIAKQLYDNQLANNETGHNYLYNNVLNVVTINEGKVDAVKNLFTALGVTSTEDALYEGCGKVVYETLSDYVANGYVVGAGRSGEPIFAIATELVTDIETKLGTTLESWLEANLYYEKVAAPSSVVEG